MLWKGYLVVLEFTELAPQHEQAYEDLLTMCPWAMLNHSLSYRRFLKDFLPTTTEDHYILAFEGTLLVGALPCFLMDGPLGPVLNSLPFFGSHGGVLLRPNASPAIASGLAEVMVRLCLQRDVTFATVIDTPFSNNEDVFKRAIGFQYRDQRIGQITLLPEIGSSEQVEKSLLALYHQKTRNIVRKALRNDLVFCHEQSQRVLDALHALHEANILGIGGIAKPKRFFSSISNQMEYDQDYRVYIARTEAGEIVCALMLLYFKDTVEYFVPATAENWRVAQPLSALIHLAMRDAILERGIRKWNWGGTWLSQEGVYHFKSRWGTMDYPYSYYTRVFSGAQSINGVSRQTLLHGYPWFYTMPFSALER